MKKIFKTVIKSFSYTHKKSFKKINSKKIKRNLLKRKTQCIIIIPFIIYSSDDGFVISNEVNIVLVCNN